MNTCIKANSHLKIALNTKHLKTNDENNEVNEGNREKNCSKSVQKVVSSATFFKWEKRKFLAYRRTKFDNMHCV